MTWKCTWTCHRQRTLPGAAPSKEGLFCKCSLLSHEHKSTAFHCLDGHSEQLTCLFSVMALGWHLVQMPLGHGRCPSHPDLILQLMFSRATNFPLSKKTQLNYFNTPRVKTLGDWKSHVKCLTPAEQSSRKLSTWQAAAGETREELLSWAPSFCPAHGDYAET